MHFKIKRNYKPNNIGVSTVLATLLMIAVAIAASLVTYAWVMGYLGGVSATEAVSVNITAEIYSPSLNVGVLNDEAVFHVHINSALKTGIMLFLIVQAEEHVLSNETIFLEPNSEKSLTINQRLIYTGVWVIMVQSIDKKIIESHSFKTLANNVEAEVEINQRKDFQTTKYISIAALVVAILSLSKDTFHRYLRKKQRDMLTTIFVGTIVIGLPVVAILFLFEI